MKIIATAPGGAYVFDEKVHETGLPEDAAEFGYFADANNVICWKPTISQLNIMIDAVKLVADIVECREVDEDEARRVMEVAVGEALL